MRERDGALARRLAALRAATSSGPGSIRPAICLSVTLLGMAAVLGFRALAKTPNRPGAPAGAGDGHEFKGHPWFAAAYDLTTRAGESEVLGRFRPLVAGQATGMVLDIGAGTGANFAYYQRAEKVLAAEPDPFMLRRAVKRARRLGLGVEFHRATAEALPFPDSSFDTVVATLVLCTVADLAGALAEVRRVLRPGGTFRFIEHVRAEGEAAARVQDVLTPAWRQLGAGCHLNRRTTDAIQAAGFEIVEMRQEAPFPLLPLVAGVARPV